MSNISVIVNDSNNITAVVDQGVIGPTGAAATIAVGTTTTLSPGASATVNNSGTSGAAVFNFGIPQGAIGTAATIAAGTTTTLAPGASATVNNSGTSSAAVFDFGVPQGPVGAAATIAVGTTTTLSPGASATVNNSGTSGAAVFNFGVPQGPVGTAATIAAGTTTTLAPGASATVTNSGTSAAAVFDFGVPQGPVGPTGIPGINWLGTWSSATAYVVRDAVTYNGTSYYAIAANTNQAPPNISFWDILAEKGADGAGAVSSVGLSAPALFTVSNSPVTSSGTLALTYSGTALPVENGGTGLTSPGASGNILTSNGTTWTSSPNLGVTTGKSIAMAMIFGF